MPSIAHSRHSEGGIAAPVTRARRAATKTATKTDDKPRLRAVESWDEPKPTPRPREVGVERHDGHSTMMAYLQDVRRHALLSREEEHQIAVEYLRTSDPRLSERLVTANLRLVVKIALEYRTARRNLLDLVQEGNVWLVHAVQNYDPHRGVKLATYAAWWIRAYILNFILSNARLVKLGTTQAQRRLFFGLRRERARLEGLDGEAVEARQLAATFDVSEKEVVEMERRLSGAEASLDAPGRGEDGDGRSRGEALTAEDGARPDVEVETKELRAAVSREIGVFRQTLTGRDVEIFEGRLACDESTTLAEIAVRFGVSRERVRQIEDRLKMRMRRHLVAALGDAMPALP